MFEGRLERLAGRVAGTLGVALVAGDGIAVATHVNRDGLDLEALAAELLVLVRRISEEDREPSVGRVRGFSVVGEEMTLALRTVTGGYCLLMVLADEADLGRARYELRRAGLDFEDDLI